MRRRVAVAVAVAVLVGVGIAGLAGAGSVSPPAEEVRPSTPTPMGPPFVSSPDDQVPVGTPGVEEARARLKTIPRAEPRAGQEPYREEAFGRPWADPDGNGCDSRQDAFRAWLGSVHPASPCGARGVVEDPYSGRSLVIPDEAVLDLVVSLRQAWRSGADRWSKEKRVAFANDPANLVPTSEAALVVKAGQAADGWLPPEPSYWCEYARSYVGTKAGYSLTVTRDEAQALEIALDTCAPSTVTGVPTVS